MRRSAARIGEKLRIGRMPPQHPLCLRWPECVEYPELGMEAIWKIEIENFPAFIVVDDKGNDFFAEFKKPVPA